MRLSFILFMFLIPSFLFSQEIEPKKGSPGSRLMEKYHVLKSDKNVKHCEYQLYNNKKLCAQGVYNNNQRCGIWYFFDENDTVYIYDFDQNEVLKHVCIDKFQNCRSSGSSAFPLNGFNTILWDNVKNLKYPENIAEKGGSGRPVVSVIIDDKGKFKNSFVSEYSGYVELDQEAQRVIEKSCQNLEYFPAYDENNKGITDTLKFAIVFSLQ